LNCAPSPAGPPLLVEPASVVAGEGGAWRVAWRIENRDDQPVELIETWVPHGRFRAEGVRDTTVRRLEGRGASSLELTVRFSESPGTVVENAFLILQLQWRGHSWRLFARHRVEADPGGAPRPICEVITTQPIGFSAPGRV